MRLILLLLAAPLLAFAQGNPAYFQQQVNYKINVTLDDTKHTVTGDIDFEYINNSPDALSELYIHLWGNAFKDKRSAFCKQKLRDGSTKYYFSAEKDRGYYSNLDFSVNGEKAAWKIAPDNPDIAVLTLPRALRPGERIRVTTPFILKIPDSFSRLGHVGTSYQMTQWYPKPAVYDHKGWHAIPYLDMGEFYSEFGSFDVTITLPDNYVVGATGVLQSPQEEAFLEAKVKESLERLAKGVDKKSDPFPSSSTTFKTIRYTAENVHDFAWFADKRFMVLKDTARLSSGKMVPCWAMFTNSQSDLWKKGAFYVRRAVEFYSEKVGEYPWPQATAVHSALSAGGGMEYPMITVIGDSNNASGLDDVITHEVGHNWFYGILASNERDHPFMDEGLNSYYENRYMRQFYGKHDPLGLPKALYNPDKNGPILNNAYLLLARDHKDTPPDSHANSFTLVAYGLEVYMKTAMCMHWLEQAMGTERFDAMMQDYFKKWRFRHPYPEDLLAHMEAHDPQAGWFLKTMQTGQQADYALTNVKKLDGGNWELTIKEAGSLSAPFPVSAMKDGKALSTKWYWDFVPKAGEKKGPAERKVRFEAADADAFVIDQDFATLDVTRKNNTRRSAGFLPGVEPLQVKAGAIFQSPKRSTIGLLPWIGWNNAGKTMLGLALYNPPLPQPAFQLLAMPGYATGSGHFIGMADLKYRFFPGGIFRKVTLSTGFKMFDYDYHPRDKYYSRFYRFMPQIRAELPSSTHAFTHALNFRTLFIGKETGKYDAVGAFKGQEWKNSLVHELRYEGEQKGMPRPFSYRVALENRQYHDVFDRSAHYLLSTVEWQQHLYYKPKRKISYRFFTGYFLQNTQRHRNIDESSLSLNPQGFNDYKYDQIFLARGGSDGLLGRQLSQTGGGFKGAFGESFAGAIGNSNNFVAALNIKADLPVRLPVGLPIKPYFDLGYFDDATADGENRPASEQWLWSGGFAISILNGGLEFYFPVVHSENLRTLYKQQADGHYLRTISWSMRINLSDPVSIIEGLARR